MLNRSGNTTDNLCFRYRFRGSITKLYYLATVAQMAHLSYLAQPVKFTQLSNLPLLD